MELGNQQKQVFDDLKKWINDNYRLKSLSYKVLFGYAGTGKTTISTLLRQEFSNLKFSFLAFTGKASSVLRKTLSDFKSIDENDFIGTIHSFIYKPIIKFNPITKKDELVGWKIKNPEENTFDIVIVDEFSMLDNKLLNDLKYFCKEKLILFSGDPFQLGPISENSNSLKNFDYLLTDIHRQAMDNPIIRISSFIRSNDYTNLKYGKFSEDVYKIKFNFDDFDYLVDRVDLFKSEVICLCYTNISRKKLNNKIREKKSFNIETPYPGEKLICLKNNKNLGIYNGEIGTCVYSLFKDKDILDIFIDFEDKSFSLDVSSIIFSDKEHKINLIELYRKNSNNKKNVCYFDFGYTITVHKSQGSSWEKVIVLDQKENYFKNKELYKRWLYTAITRSKQKLLILSNI